MRSHANMPKGGCVIHTDYERNVLYVEHAAPRILIADELLDEWRQGHHHPAVDFNESAGIVRINGQNQRVIYRLVEHVPEWGSWIAEWPD